ncbi:MAG: signal recognition particle-docking protein FtsY [Chloroflexi bacterium]|nr:signal recognition particle-docking protein FtsY [Chloroflexota bacterium]
MFRRSRPLEQGLTRTRQSFFGKITGLLTGTGQVTDGLWSELEGLLIQADVGVSTTVELVEKVRARAAREKIRDTAGVKQALQEAMLELLQGAAPPPSPIFYPLPSASHPLPAPLYVILVVGVNGVGKTTGIAKLANLYRQAGLDTVVAAADTFRAAAIEQLQVWGQRVGATVIAHQPGADPGAVVFDALQSCLARKAQVLIIDTAGRLHTKYNLMEELKKVKRVIAKQVPGAPHEVVLVIDATTGQNALAQARQFTQAVEVSGIFLAKLDGTAKGGMAFAIARELGIPIRYVGTGEAVDDVAGFDPQEFVRALFA